MKNLLSAHELGHRKLDIKLRALLQGLGLNLPRHPPRAVALQQPSFSWQTQCHLGLPF